MSSIDHVRVKKPPCLNFSRYKGKWSAQLKSDVGITGFGDTIEESRKDLIDQLADIFISGEKALKKGVALDSRQAWRHKKLSHIFELISPAEAHENKVKRTGDFRAGTRSFSEICKDLDIDY